MLTLSPFPKVAKNVIVDNLLSFELSNPSIYLTFLEIRIIDLHSAADSMGLSSFKFFRWVRRMIFSQEWHFGRSRSSKIIDFGTNRKQVCDFSLLSCTVSEIF